MTRSERLAKEGIVEVNVGSLEKAKVISKDELPLKNVRYIGTDFEALYDGKEVTVDCYEDNENGSLYGVVSL